MSFTFNLESEGGDSEVQSDGRIVSTYWQRFLYKTTALSRPTNAMITSDIGILSGSPFPGDTNATCFKANVADNGVKTRPPNLAYFVKFDWSTAATLPVSVSTDPTTQRTIWSIRPTIQQRFVTRYPTLPPSSSSSSSSSSVDLAGTIILNTAGQPPDGGIPVDVRLGTAIARRNITAAGYNRGTVMAKSGWINSVTYLGAPPGTLQVDIESDERFEGAYHFYAETYTFNYDPLGMQPTFPSAGFYQRRSIGSSTLDPIEVSPGVMVQEPEPLDNNGILVPVSARPASCYIIKVPYFGTMDFNSFSL